MFSALPSNSDMARRSRHVANVQDLEVADLQPTSRGTHQWRRERPSHLSDNQGSIRRSGPAKGHERVEEPAPTHLRQPAHPPECAAGCQDQSRSAQGGQARIDYLNSGMRKEMRTEFKRITSVYEEFHSEKNIRTRHLGERRYAHGNHAVAA